MCHRSPATAAFLFLCALPLAAQEPAPTNGELRALDERARDELHPGENPLEIVGREQAGNDLRARTPALAHSECVAAAVDPVAAYERALALYAGTTFHAPPATSAQPVSDAREPAEATRTRLAAPEPAPEPASWCASLPAFLVGVLALLFLYFRYRGTPSR
jgi:hypothetical protein